MMKKPRRYEDYVVRLSNGNRYRDVVVNVEINTTEMPHSYNFYLASLTALEEKAKPGEKVMRVSLKGYS